MNTKLIEKNWSEIKSKIKAQWSKFSDDQIDGLKSDLSLLSSKIQTIYGATKDEADRQYADFKKSAQTLISDDTAVESEKETPMADMPKAPLKAAVQPSAQSTDSSRAV